MHKIRIIAVTFLVTILILYTGSTLLPSPDIYSKISNGLKLFGQVYKQVSTTYVDEIDPETFVEAAIRGMLQTLDPYTTYISSENNSDINILTTGMYGGVGIKLGIRGDTLTVISPMEGTPAGRSGILAGDKIIKIDSVMSFGLKLDDAAKLIRGPEGEEIRLTIYRQSISEPLEFLLMREKIVVNEVLYSGFITEGIGYLRLTGFSKSSINKFKEALLELNSDGLDGLIVDLRDNPGGLLDAALKISDMFIEKGELLVSTKGRIAQMNNEHYSKIDPLISMDVQLIVLVNGGSASASEIFSGIIQDLDRGIIVGTKTFGKGLVQSVFSMSDDKKVKVTTGKYYIPSGRLIQKEDYFSNDEVVKREFADSIFVTSNGRPVFGGGGIKPDFLIKYPKTSNLIPHLWRKNMFYRYSSNWVSKHKEASYPVSITDADVEDFIDYVQNLNFSYKSNVIRSHTDLINALESANYTDEVINKVKNLKSDFRSLKDDFSGEDYEQIKRILSREISEILGKTKGRYESIFKNDLAIQKSMELLDDLLLYKRTLGLID